MGLRLIRNYCVAWYRLFFPGNLDPWARVENNIVVIAGNVFIICMMAIAMIVLTVTK